MAPRSQAGSSGLRLALQEPGRGSTHILTFTFKLGVQGVGWGSPGGPSEQETERADARPQGRPEVIHDATPRHGGPRAPAPLPARAHSGPGTAGSAAAGTQLTRPFPARRLRAAAPPGGGTTRSLGRDKPGGGGPAGPAGGGRGPQRPRDRLGVRNSAGFGFCPFFLCDPRQVTYLSSSLLIYKIRLGT